MGTTAGPIYDVGESEFEERVVRASSERPVVVDFWAPWCAPCRTLGPILAKVVASFDGQMALAKVNVDGARALAQRYRVQGIPAVKVFRDRRVVAEFVGARSEDDVRGILARAFPSEADRLTAAAATLARSGRMEEAEAEYRRVLEEEPGHPDALVGLAQTAMKKGDLEKSRAALSRLEPGTPQHARAEPVLAQLDFLKECADHRGKAVAEKAVAARPHDLDAMHALAACLTAEGNYTAALEGFLRVVERDKGHRDGAARRAMLRVFSIVGKRSPLAEEYRSKLARVLY